MNAQRVIDVINLLGLHFVWECKIKNNVLSFTILIASYNTHTQETYDNETTTDIVKQIKSLSFVKHVYVRHGRLYEFFDTCFMSHRIFVTFNKE